MPGTWEASFCHSSYDAAAPPESLRTKPGTSVSPRLEITMLGLSLFTSVLLLARLLGTSVLGWWDAELALWLTVWISAGADIFIPSQPQKLHLTCTVVPAPASLSYMLRLGRFKAPVSQSHSHFPGGDLPTADMSWAGHWPPVCLGSGPSFPICKMRCWRHSLNVQQWLQNIRSLWCPSALNSPWPRAGAQ